ncbi:hypothetical protein RHGRI_031719 [Rhododendron griersonianum]|uniref:PHD finger protein EHD3 n=1 Tax=Rhododendron griersonianum TaxID=479676 RepID=A0AAV6I9D1_9ERIC|nr:hypothetical protein RHGRI_031719 [Rhododendron griersonianum]KAG5525138.1 hypothetical protein RHGRI_031719 [Rhododendron griersonianum]
MVDGERESNGGGAECAGAVVDMSGDGVDGSGMVVENEPIEVEKAAGGSVNGSTIEVAVNGLAIDAENDPIEVKKGAGGLVNGSAIGVENGTVDAVNGLVIDAENGPIEVEKGACGSVNGSAIGVEDGAVDPVNGLAIDAENDPIEVENGADKAVNGLPTEAENGAVDAVNGLAMDVENDRIEVEKGADKAANGFATEAENGAADIGNGFKTEVETRAVGDGNSAGSSCEGLRTYKRRKLNKMASLEIKLPEDGNVSADSVIRLPDKSKEDPFQGVQHDSSREQFNHPRIVSHTAMSSDDCPLNRWTKAVLEQMYQSLRDDCENEGGLQGCIQKALLSHPESSRRSAAKASVHSGDDNHKCSSRTECIANGTHDASRGNVNLMSNGSLSEPSHTNADACGRAFFDIAVSEKFAELCGLLLENFQGIKVDSFLDISLINSRMKQGAYESSPALFHSDMQQLWTKLQNVGAEMVALGKSLSVKSRASCQEQFPMVESDSQTKPEQTEACGVYKVCACCRCGEMSNGRDCLVCDSCEELYHVSCIEPAVEEIPPKSWYCAKCTANGIGSPHGDCVVCEKLNASRNQDGEIEENSNGLSKHGVPQVKEGKTYHECNVCRNEVDNDRFMVCGHSQCFHKYYHVKCLTKKQINTYGPCWYCPSCLCRACLTDCDDEKIVMCDGCDHAYHIYCMRPPRSSIPRGKWFCRKCNVGIQRIRKAKKEYENIQSRLKKREGDKEGAFENLLIDRKESEGLINNSGGVDMLLTAAKTLKFEEKMAGVKTKS